MAIISNFQNKENDMFGKGKSREGNHASIPQPPRPSLVTPARPDAPETVSSISTGMTIVGKLAGEGLLKIYGRVEGEVHAATVWISDGAEVEGNIVAQEVTVGGRIKGTIHANRVTLNSTAIVEGDIFHRSLLVEENARFEGSSQREDNVIDVASVQHIKISIPQSLAHPEDAPGAAKPNINGTTNNMDPSDILEMSPLTA
jgi:cytoskeletal protein CcmA (bactofilin family)